MIDLFFLKTFVTVTRTKSFRIAAERNHITQPAVSQHIQILEKRLGARLLERHGKKFSLTPAGLTFLSYAENILQQFDEAKMRVLETSGELRGSIRIATIYSIGLYNLKPIIRKFFKKYPKIELRLEYLPSASIYEMVLNQTIDFGLVAYPQDKTGVAADTFVEDPLVFAQSPAHRQIKKKTALLKDFNDLRFVAFSPLTPTGKVLGQYFFSKKVAPKIIHEYDNVELIKSAVLLGLGCAILPRSTVTRELKEGALETVAVRGFHLKRPLGVLYPQKKPLTKITQAFYDALITTKNPDLKERALRV